MRRSGVLATAAEVTLVVVVAVVLTVAVVLSVSAQISPPCPPDARCSQEPPDGPRLIAGNTPDAQAALEEILAVLKVHGVQLSYRERVNRDGTRKPEIVVEQVYFSIAEPGRRR
jgi:hypothetical protein